MSRPEAAADPRLAMIDGGYAWFRMVVSLLVSSFGSAGMWTIVVVLPAVQDEFGVDRSDASMAYTTTMIGFGIGNMLIGRAVDRFGAVAPLLAGSVALGGGLVLAGLAHDFWTLVALQGALIGFGAAASFAPLIADVSHWFVKRRGIAVAVVATGNYLGGALWPILIGALMEFSGWRLAYLASGAICLAAMVPMALLLSGRPPQSHAVAGRGPTGAAKSIDIPPATLQWLLVIAGVACCVAMSMPQVHIVALCSDLGFGVTAGAEMLALMLFSGAFSRVASGWLADRIGGVQTLLLGSVGQCLALFLYLPFDGLMSLYAVSFIFGLSQGGIVPSYAVIIREYLPSKDAGARIGMVIMATIIGMALGGWLSGWIYDLTGSYEAAFINGIAWNLLNMGIMVLLLWRTDERRRMAAA
ncbi:MAG: MFS transporter [Flavobacteriaceae bacterium]